MIGACVIVVLGIVVVACVILGALVVCIQHAAKRVMRLVVEEVPW